MFKTRYLHIIILFIKFTCTYCEITLIILDNSYWQAEASYNLTQNVLIKLLRQQTIIQGFQDHWRPTAENDSWHYIELIIISTQYSGEGGRLVTFRELIYDNWYLYHRL